MSDVIGKTCPYCQTPIKPGEQVVFCSSCGIPHHQECWNEGRECTTFGCSGRPAAEPSARNTGNSTTVMDIEINPNTRYCRNCGSATNDSAVYCSRCATRIEDTGLLGDSYTSNSTLDRYPRHRSGPSWVVYGLWGLTLIALVCCIVILININKQASMDDEGKKDTNAIKLSDDEIDFIKVQNIIKDEAMYGQFSVYIKDLKTGKQYYTYNKDESFIAAGLVFLPILIEVLGQSDSGYINPDYGVVIYRDMLVGGTGKLGPKHIGSWISIKDLIAIMLTYSDNSAANILLDQVGGLEQVNLTMENLGLSRTRLNRRLMDTYAMNQGIENYTTAEDMGKLLEAFTKLNIDELLLKPQKEGMELYLPETCNVYHQVGVLSKTYNDAGIIRGRSSHFILVVLSNGTTNDVSKSVIGKIAQSVYEDLEREKK